ncbi:hypothetical protein [Azospirillum sp. B4]|uniref:glycoside hydrolase family 78 protein n=1 Tax=Azospirillum sp. B4 TaxID=95605 RepID=UPI00034D7CF3|nr:hypothetical protein [Azospirillum sp. B4]
MAVRDQRHGRGGRLRGIACCGILLLGGCAGGEMPQGLQVEYASQPLGIDMPAPRLAWLSPVARQSAYRIRVADSAEALSAEGPLVWDSGRVAATDNIQIPYAGPALAGGRRYWWQVMVWDEAGKPGAWSRPDWWETGLTGPEQWQARWISGPAQTVHDWSDLTLDVDLTLKGTSLDVLFRARPEGKKFGEAYVWTLSDTKDGPLLIQSVRHTLGGKNGGQRTTELGRAALPGGPLKDTRRRLTIRAEGQRLTTLLDGVEVAAITDASQTHGTLGFTAKQADAALIHRVRVTGSGAPAVETTFADNDNPFTGGRVRPEGLMVAAGVPSVDIVLPMEAPAPLLRREFTLPDTKKIVRARLYWAGGRPAAPVVERGAGWGVGPGIGLHRL